MRRLSPKLLVLIAAMLTIALVAYVFAGGSSRGDGLPEDRLADQPRATTPGPAEPPADTWASLPGENEAAPPPPPPPPPPEPEVEPGSSTQPKPVVRPAPPALKRAAETERETARARTQAKASAEAARKKTAAASAPNRQRSPAAPARIAKASPSPQVAIARPSYNCRYARTRSELAVCGDAGLASLDRQMAAQFTNAMRQGTPAQREVLERSRLRFLYRRERCRTATCIAATYRARMTEIDDIAARHWRTP